MKAYSLDLRQRAVNAVKEEGLSVKAAAERFGISRWSVNRYLKRADAGKLEADKHPGQSKHLSQEGIEVLKAQVKNHPDWTLEKHAQALKNSTDVNLKKSSIGNYLKQLRITIKKDVLSPREK